jgi:hypothetical protein
MFTDNAGRQWQISVNVDSIRRVRNTLNVDLMELGTGQLAQRLANDPVLLADILWVLCQPQAEKAGVGSEQFGTALAGDALDQATTQLFEGIADFFPQQRRRQVVRAALNKAKELDAAIAEQAVRKIEAMDPVSVAERLLRGDSSGNAPA